jgi:hypothetical protein
MDRPAQNNTPHIRELIKAVRQKNPYRDMVPVRMLRNFRVGTDRMTNKQGER